MDGNNFRNFKIFWYNSVQERLVHYLGIGSIIYTIVALYNLFDKSPGPLLFFGFSDLVIFNTSNGATGLRKKNYEQAGWACMTKGVYVMAERYDLFAVQCLQKNG